MSKTALEGVDSHPLVAILEQHDESPVEFSGFLGTGDKHILHLYPDLTVSAWIEIPMDSVVHWERDSSDPQRIKVFVSPKAEILEITRRRLPARESRISRFRWGGLSVDKDRRPVLPKVNTCIGFCEEEFEAAYGRATVLFLQANIAEAKGQNDVAAMLRAAGHEIKTQSLLDLTACLEHCQPLPTRGVPLPGGGFTIRQETIEEVSHRIIQNVLSRN